MLKTIFYLFFIVLLSNNVFSKEISISLKQRTEKALEDQLSCKNPPEPGKAIRAMISNGIIKETDLGYDGIPIFTPTIELVVFGKRVTYIAGWEFDEKEGVKEPFSRGPGTAPPVFIAVSLDSKLSDINYKEHRVSGVDGTPEGSIEKGSLNIIDSKEEKQGITIHCYK